MLSRQKGAGASENKHHKPIMCDLSVDEAGWLTACHWPRRLHTTITQQSHNSRWIKVSKLIFEKTQKLRAGRTGWHFLSALVNFMTFDPLTPVRLRPQKPFTPPRLRLSEQSRPPAREKVIKARSSGDQHHVWHIKAFDRQRRLSSPPSDFQFIAAAVVGGAGGGARQLTSLLWCREERQPVTKGSFWCLSMLFFVSPTLGAFCHTAALRVNRRNKALENLSASAFYTLAPWMHK